MEERRASSIGAFVIYGSVCSGIEAASVAWEPLGWKPAWFAENDKFPSAVLADRWPAVPNLGDMTKIHDSEVFRGSKIDVLVGGTPWKLDGGPGCALARGEDFPS